MTHDTVHDKFTDCEVVFTAGMWAHTLTVKDYQALIDRGWRRSGSYVYKPSMKQTCCPQYPIRCNSLDFKLSRSQKKVIKKVNRFLNTGVRPGPKDSDSADGIANMETEVKETIPNVDQIKASDIGADIDASRLSSQQTVIDSDSVMSASKQSDVNLAASVDVKTKENPKICDKTDASNPKKSPRPGQGADASKPKCMKAKLRRQQVWQEKHPSDKLSTKRSQEVKSLEDHLNDIDPNPKHKLELRLVHSHPQSAQFEESFSESHTVYKAYQMSIHKDPPEKLSTNQYTRFLCTSPLKVRLTRRNNPDSRDFEARFVESFKVYRKYQMQIHKDSAEDCDQQGYTRFLVDSPLKAESSIEGFPGFGSFHQQYLLDGKIIAVGVVDILPHCVSSVYLYYDPEYYFLSLGVYSALRELAFTRHLSTMEPALKYYYMGFYIHSCPKMKYKGGYSPSFLACPETYAWIPVEECTPKLEVNKYSRFASQGKVNPDNSLDLPELLVLFCRQAMPYSVYQALNVGVEDEEEVREYGQLVGNSLAKRMLLYRE